MSYAGEAVAGSAPPWWSAPREGKRDQRERLTPGPATRRHGWVLLECSGSWVAACDATGERRRLCLRADGSAGEAGRLFRAWADANPKDGEAG